MTFINPETGLYEQLRSRMQRHARAMSRGLEDLLDLCNEDGKSPEERLAAVRGAATALKTAACSHMADFLPKTEKPKEG